MPSVWDSMSPQEAASYGHERVKHAAHAAIKAVLKRRLGQGMTQESIAKKIGKDQGWLSRVIRGPGNVTLKTLGALAEGMDSIVEVRVVPKEDRKSANYDAYLVMRPTSADGRYNTSPAKNRIDSNNREKEYDVRTVMRRVETCAF